MKPELTDLHLTDREFATLLDGGHESRSEEHVARCAACRAEVAALGSSILNFRVAVTGFAAASVPAQPALRPTNVTQIWRRPRATGAAGLVAAMALCTVSISVLHHPARHAAVHPGNAVAVDASTDSRLLEDIDEDVSDSVPPSLQPLDVAQTAEHSAAATHN